ncbi:putative ribonuclease H protein [Glycine soja]|uniref:Putative ribonuclease H protein n=1 Tax=Glycine soja TaxID=3848 RepID=A0A445IWR8_GLYSO|nr:putative ribonuclease H protein [Glycine soja]
MSTLLRFKLNIDGSSIGNPGNAGFGGIIRDSFGDWHAGFYGSCGTATSLQAELLAILHGLNLSWDKGFRNIQCESDSKLALQLISEGRNSLHPYASIIQKIQDFKLLHWDLHFNHTFREGNMCADELAKTGSSLQCNLQVFNGCPPFITQLVLADRKGAQYIRH